MALEYGHTITIEKDGSSIPDSPHTNQWQKRPKGGVYADIPGETGDTYTVEEEDREADIRLVQTFGGAKAYSNALTVTAEDPDCPYDDPIEFPHIDKNRAENGDTLTMTLRLQIPGVAESNYPPVWFGIPSMSAIGTREVIQNGGFNLEVTDEWAQKYEGIIVNQTYKEADDLDPICVGFYADSLPCTINYVPGKTFGPNKLLLGPTVVQVGEDVEYELTYDGDVIHYKAEPKWPFGYADFISETKVAGSYKFVLNFHTAGGGRVECTLTSEETKTSGENPVPRGKSVTASAPAYTLGTVSLDGPDEAETDVEYEYTISWTGDAPADQVTWQWITDGNLKNPTQLTSTVSWSSEGDHFVWAQVSYNGDTQMPMLEPITVKKPSIDTGASEFGNNQPKNTYYGGVVGVDGNVYYASKYKGTLMINTSNEKTKRGDEGPYQSHYGGCLLQDGRMFFATDNGKHTIYDPVAKIYEDVEGFVEGQWPYTTWAPSRDAVITTSGRVFVGPQTEMVWQEIDPTRLTETLIGLNTWGNEGLTYQGMVYHPNGKIYSFPRTSSYDGSSAPVAEFDPSTNTASAWGDVVSALGQRSGNNMYSGAVLAPNEKIYLVPWTSGKVMEVDVRAKSMRTIGSDLGVKGWMGGCLAPNGLIYCAPYDASSILEIDPVNRSTRTFGNLGDTPRKWAGLTLAPNGTMYAPPYNVQKCLKIEFFPPATGPAGQESWPLNGLPGNKLDPRAPYHNSF